MTSSPFRRTTWRGNRSLPILQKHALAPQVNGIIPSPLVSSKQVQLDDDTEPKPSNVNVPITKQTVFVSIKDKRGVFYGYAFSTKEKPFEIIERCKSNVHVRGDFSLTIHPMKYRVVDSHINKPLDSMKFIQGCQEHGIVPYFVLMERKAILDFENIEQIGEYLLRLRLKYDIIENNFRELCQSYGDEFYKFRRVLASVCDQEHEYQLQFDPYIWAENEYVYMNNEPPIQPELLNTRCMIKGILFEQNMDKTIAAFPTDPVQNIIASLFNKFLQTNTAAFSPTDKPEDFVLKVRGKHEFLVPFKRDGSQYLLGEFDYIRRCVMTNTTNKAKSQPIEVFLKPRKMLHQFVGPLDAHYASFDHVFNQLLNIETWDQVKTETKMESQTNVIQNYFITIKSLANCVYYKPIVNKSKKEQEQTQPEFMSVKTFRAYIVASLFHGPRQLCKSSICPVFQVTDSLASIEKQLEFELPIKILPKETKLVLSVILTDEYPLGVVPSALKEQRKNETPIGTINVKIADHNDFLLHGLCVCGMWEMAGANFISMCSENTSARAIKMTFEYPTFSSPIKMDAFNDTSIDVPKEHPPTADEIKQLQVCLEANPLERLKENEMKLVWKQRYLIKKTRPKNLSRVISSVDCLDVKAVIELHKIIQDWTLLDPQTAIEMLDFKFPDQKARNFALRCLDKMGDNELLAFLPQLVQALKFELHHYSDLALFLLRRALRNKNQIGHQLFWFLKAELHDHRVTERYGLLLEAFLGACGKFQTELFNEVRFQNDLVKIANEVKVIPTREEQKAHLIASLAKIEFPESMALPIDSRLRFSRPTPGAGNVFSSKKKPLLLILQNCDPAGEDIRVIQKVGDDLRQDILTLQILRIMFNMLKNSQLDIRMLPYQCIATGNEIGMLELVKDSETYGAIMAADERKLSVIGRDTVTQWMIRQCQRPESKVSFEEAVENFVHSCAGYCVTTYLLGIGDRHSDNVMIRRDGIFFHIDFGHFLGNFKSKFGIRRERTPFKFTIHFADLMGYEGKSNKPFLEFVDLCKSALVALRRQGSLFIYLFRLMLATGIPELKSEEDIEYLKNAFLFNEPEETVKKTFEAMIYDCISAKINMNTINDIVHDFVHYGK